MKATVARLSAKDYIASLAAGGRYHFSTGEAKRALQVSPAATRLALGRLSKHGLIASPARGFYVIVPPEYKALGCLPAEQFIPALMAHANQRYYVGLLSAAQYYGAAHHRPQEFQVVLEKPRRPLHCGAVSIAFVVRRRLRDVRTTHFNTPRGTLLVSSPEATVLDLAGYMRRAGGLNHVATVLSELAPLVDAERLAEAAESVPVGWAQRAGYLLNHLGFNAKTPALRQYVHGHARQSVRLLPAAPRRRSRRDHVWKLWVNVEVEPAQ